MQDFFLSVPFPSFSICLFLLIASTVYILALCVAFIGYISVICVLYEFVMYRMKIIKT